MNIKFSVTVTNNIASSYEKEKKKKTLDFVVCLLTLLFVDLHHIDCISLLPKLFKNTYGSFIEEYGFIAVSFKCCFIYTRNLRKL